MNKVNYKNINKIIKIGVIKIDEPMSLHTSFGIGGNTCFVLPANAKELSDLLIYCSNNYIETFFAGSGSNLLVSDKGFSGIVISLKKTFKKLLISKNGIINSESGVMLGTLVKNAMKNKIIGLESLIGVPGTLGGALIMNAGAYGSEISNNLISVESIDYRGNIKNYKVKNLNFTYRGSSFSKNELLLNATFKCKKGNKKIIHTKKINASNQRKEKQPLKYRSAGSIFKNPSSEYAAGYLIDKSGLKGLQIGGAQISTKHANFIINKNNEATYKEVVELIEIIKKKVLSMFNIKLELEIKIIGGNL